MKKETWQFLSDASKDILKFPLDSSDASKQIKILAKSWQKNTTPGYTITLSYHYGAVVAPIELTVTGLTTKIYIKNGQINTRDFSLPAVK